jgi:hypothetical protein
MRDQGLACGGDGRVIGDFEFDRRLRLEIAERPEQLHL